MSEGNGNEVKASELSPLSAEHNARQSDMPMFCYDAKPEMVQGLDFGSRPMMDEASKLYVCHLCDFRTAFRNSLLNHQAVHSDSRPWVCAMCDYAAKRKQDLKKHLHTIHGMMVDSTMLKPVEAKQENTSRGESSEENNSSDGPKVNNRHLETEAPSFLPQTGGDAKVDLHSPGHSNMMQGYVKQEIMSPGSSHFLPRTTSESDNKTIEDSPDDDLPISFPPVPPSASASDRGDSQPSDDDHPSHSQMYTNPGPGGGKFHDNKVRHGQFVSPNFSPLPMSSPPMHMTRSSYNHDFTPISSNNFPVQNRKRHHFRENSTPFHDVLGPNGNASNQPRLGPPMIKRARSPEKEDAPCSSSAGSSHVKASQTQTAFLCEHCNIMFFQRAMYLMHMGLHSNENPWQCTVCGFTFTEVYSFTSHFINQH
ncbi:Zinc finger protein aiolos [Plakobranchus ocellatus]|uniref:Zinc finger protein aiolos n=1 Tax=Plakobranchus ocellatus TaxID=259542 RepID=A0AAV4CDI5_9GAST|nr:Zinc finger protein aiolos [Plakobranchus ocellatus]